MRSKGRGQDWCPVPCRAWGQGWVTVGSGRVIGGRYGDGRVSVVVVVVMVVISSIPIDPADVVRSSYPTPCRANRPVAVTYM